MFTFSIVIPASDNVGLLEETLLSVLENRPDDVEIIVVHRGDYADPYDLTDEVRYVELDPEATLADCIEAGAEASRGSLVHLLASGMQVDDGWAEPALNCFDEVDCGAVAPAIVDDNHRILMTGIGFGWSGSSCPRRHRRLRAVDGAPLEGAFFRRRLLLDLLDLSQSSAQVGPQLLDVDLGMSLQAVGYRTVSAPECRILGPAPARPTESGFSRGLHAERLFLRHATHVGLMKAWLLHLTACAYRFALDLMSGGAFMSLLGRLLGLLSLADARRHHRALKELRTRHLTAAPRLDDEEDLTAESPQTIPMRATHQHTPYGGVDDAYPSTRAS